MNRRDFLATGGAAALVAFGSTSAAAKSMDAQDGGAGAQTGHCYHDCQECLNSQTCWDCSRACNPFIE